MCKANFPIPPFTGGGRENQPMSARGPARVLSLPHLIVLFVVALVIFGPQKLPELARMLGKMTADFRRMTSDFRIALEDEVRDMERHTRVQEAEKVAAPAPAEIPGTEPRALPEAPSAASPETEPTPQVVPEAEPASQAEPEAEPVPAHSAAPVQEKPSDGSNAA
jgi:sec-independent protein translocase protein TatB